MRSLRGESKIRTWPLGTPVLSTIVRHSALHPSPPPLPGLGASMSPLSSEGLRAPEGSSLGQRLEARGLLGAAGGGSGGTGKNGLVRVRFPSGSGSSTPRGGAVTERTKAAATAPSGMGPGGLCGPPALLPPARRAGREPHKSLPAQPLLHSLSSLPPQPTPAKGMGEVWPGPAQGRPQSGDCVPGPARSREGRKTWPLKSEGPAWACA